MRPWVQSYYGYWEFRFPSSSFCCCCGIDPIRGCNDANFERSPNRWTKECRKRDFGGVMAGDYCRRLRDRSRCTDIAGSRVRSWLRFGVAMVLFGSVGSDLWGLGRGMVARRPMDLGGVGRLRHRSVADQMGRGSYRRSLLPRHG